MVTAPPKLLPCPFCGGTAVLQDVEDMDDRRWYRREITCSSCDASICEGLAFREFARLGPEEAAANIATRVTTSWNTRFHYEDQS